MTRLMVGHTGEVSLPGEVFERCGLAPDTPVRVIETRGGILLVPLTDKPMTPELAQEIAEWQSLSAEGWNTFPYEEDRS